MTLWSGKARRRKIAEATELRERGWSLDGIARQLGCSSTTVSKMVKEGQHRAADVDHMRRAFATAGWKVSSL